MEARVYGAATCSFGLLGGGSRSGRDRALAGIMSARAGAAAGALWGALIEWIVEL
jgi:hypothetical protein